MDNSSKGIANWVRNGIAEFILDNISDKPRTKVEWVSIIRSIEVNPPAPKKVEYVVPSLAPNRNVGRSYADLLKGGRWLCVAVVHDHTGPNDDGLGFIMLNDGQLGWVGSDGRGIVHTGYQKHDLQLENFIPLETPE